MIIPRTPSFRLDGKRALVTGASSGIGFACAAALSEAGAAVSMAARSPEPLDAAVSALRAEDRNARALPLDIADIARVATILALEEPFDILVNCAGVARHGSAAETVAEDFDAVADVNFKGAYFLTQTVAKRLIAEGRGGSMINMSSQMALVGGIDRAVYSATKHAVEGFTKSMAIEWGPLGIRVNTVCPTFVRTPLTEKTFADPERRRWIMDKIKLGRVAQVEDIMGAVTYLASDSAAMVTGTALVVDGGWTAD